MDERQRLTISIGSDMKEMLRKYKRLTGKSHSEIVREALRSHFEHLEEMRYDFNPERARLYYEMLAGGEHVILDIDHWILFLRELNSANDSAFWEDHRRVARSHAEQFRQRRIPPAEVLRRLEACNFFTLSRSSDRDFTLVLSSEVTKRFIKTFLEEVFAGMGIEVEVREDYSKLRLRLLDPGHVENADREVAGESSMNSTASV